jgi:hypothetical protein
VAPLFDGLNWRFFLQFVELEILPQLILNSHLGGKSGMIIDRQRLNNDVTNCPVSEQQVPDVICTE